MDKARLVALYVRVSSVRQVEEGYSLEAQEKVLRDEVLKQNKLVFKVYKDAGISGAKADRPGLNALLNDAKKGLFSSVGIWTISRISRNLSHFLMVIEELNKNNITLFSISENFDLNTSIGKFTAQMLAGIAQMQRDSWRENSILGSKLRAKRGKFSGSRILGYKLVPDSNDPKGRSMLVVDAEEANIVKKIYDLYSEGYGLKAIVFRVNEEGLHGKTGGAFCIATVREILTNRIYIGYVKYYGEYYKGLHEPIITLEQWDKVQKLLESKKHCHREVDYRYLLPGLVKCPVCGSSMFPWHTYHKNKNGTVRKYYYYACGMYMNKGSSICKPNVVKALEADAKVLNFISTYLSNDAWQNKVIAEIRKRLSAGSNARQQVDFLKNRISKLKSQKLDLLIKYEDGSIDKDELTKKTAELQRLCEEAEIALQVHKVERSNYIVDEAAIRNAFNNLGKVIMMATEEDKVKLFKTVLKSVYVNADRVVNAVEVYLPNGTPDGIADTIKVNI